MEHSDGWKQVGFVWGRREFASLVVNFFPRQPIEARGGRAIREWLKKYLIVFDDVRKEDKWNEELQDHEEKLKEDERWGSIFEMDSLKSVWDIYEAARKENEEDDDTKCIDEQMNKSRGLPLAIRLMATLLPVFLDTESTAHDGSANETTSEENRTTPPLQT
ncbi:hypothetical protein Bca52824_071900 [Brassica carinata]|uniref:Uncharacterized protein n=1 Tax=Brassica carinata TaxID=52824 RepID=A0A8X7Q6V9_BRACI|nr:hypothetical protein Bca52824_071900 [Brassica carinata]